MMWIPLAMVVAWVYGIMALLGYELNSQTVTIGALTLGLGVDYAVHWAHRYEEERAREPSAGHARWVAVTTVTTGRAMAGATITTAGGFAVLNLSGLVPLRLFGTVFLIAISLALISSLLLLPALFALRPVRRRMPCLVWLPDPDGNAFWGEPAPTCVGGALGASLLDGAMVLTAGVLIIFLGSSIRWYLLDVRPRTPRTDRQWIEALRTQPTVRFDGSMATIHGVRDFSWHTSRSFDARWFDASYDLDQITEIRYLVSEFSRFRGLAHTMLDFRFENGRSLTFSFEVRCEVGETYSPWKGLWRNYELILVIGTTEDVVRLRTNASKGCVVRSYRAIPSAPGKAGTVPFPL